MKRIYLVAAAALILSALILVYSQTPLQRTRTAPTTATAELLTPDRQVSTQQRINRYFHGEAIAKIKSCWSNVPGKGTIGMKYLFTKSGERWNFTAVDVAQSSLPSNPTKVALRCMSDSIRGTSFAVDSSEGTVNKFVLNWTWPVPLPANDAQLARAMFSAKPGVNGGSGGCDGHGMPAKCYACKAGREDLSCQTVCVGKETCTITTQQGGSKTCGGETACASGGPFGVFGGSRVIY